MEGNVFPAAAVAAELKENFVEARLHYDHFVDEVKDKNREVQIAMVGSIGAPMYAVVDPATEKVLAEVQYTSAEGFLKFLRLEK